MRKARQEHMTMMSHMSVGMKPFILDIPKIVTANVLAFTPLEYVSYPFLTGAA
ncbi:hypothetical protein Krac_3907 [Ktedonobacter racemifer DSM 44963]|uniref:Uncharacterized protein n=1 Tax=Ktedonobacter racemifer DSM 44963 TaxID=485913 RepID=D6U3K8_KTERA|nr:hypothetical protein Krac_3907 [Ktedonobacter racemifer DSM 44963]